MRRIKLILSFMILTVCSSNAFAAAILVSDSGGTGAYGYGYSQWSNFTTELDAKASSVSVVSNLSDGAAMLTFDALMVDQRWTNGVLTPTELSNIAAFIATGKRVFMVGENNSWTNWNNQILGLVGGSYLSQLNSGAPNLAISNNELVDGVTSISNNLTIGRAVGGESLFEQNVGTLWGDNVLTFLDVNIFQDTNLNSLDNALFMSNVITWLTADVNGPEPASSPTSLALFAFGAITLLIRRKLNK